MTLSTINSRLITILPHLKKEVFLDEVKLNEPFRLSVLQEGKKKL